MKNITYKIMNWIGGLLLLLGYILFINKKITISDTFAIFIISLILIIPDYYLTCRRMSKEKRDSAIYWWVQFSTFPILLIVATVMFLKFFLAN